MRWLALLVLLAGCHPVSGADIEADRVIAIYERDYADITDAQAECIHDVRVRYVRKDHVERCGPVALGCTVTGLRRARVWIARGHEESLGVTLRHEYTHVLLWCVTGDSHRDHDVPEFGFSGAVNAPGSIAAEPVEEP